MNKLKLLILEEHSGTPYYIIFNLIIYSVTLTNFIFLCMISYPMTQEFIDSLNFINIFCSSVFVIEMIFKFMVLGFKGYFKDKLNIADFIVVLIGVGEVIYVRASTNPDGNNI
jgi:hypothetical protein